MFFPLCHVHQQPLKPGVFYEWSRFNPLVRRSYLLKDTMVIDDGRRVRIEMAIDLDIHELAKRSFSEGKH